MGNSTSYAEVDRTYGAPRATMGSYTGDLIEKEENARNGKRFFLKLSVIFTMLGFVDPFFFIVVMICVGISAGYHSELKRVKNY